MCRISYVETTVKSLATCSILIFSVTAICLLKFQEHLYHENLFQLKSYYSILKSSVVDVCHVMQLELYVRFQL